MTTEQPTHPAIIAGRHLVGMAVLAALNPYTLRRVEPFYMWTIAFFGGLAGAAAIYGLLALFFTKRTKEQGPKSAILAGWFVVALMVFGMWSDAPKARQISNSSLPEQQVPQGKGEISRFLEDAQSPNTHPEEAQRAQQSAQNNQSFSQKKKTTIDELMENAPPYDPIAAAARAAQEAQERAQAQAHWDMILAAHPDAEAIADTAEFQNFVRQVPRFERYLHNGTAYQVIEVFDSYKSWKRSQ